MKLLIKLGTGIIALGMSIAACAADVGLVNQLSGDVSYQAGSAAPAKASAFMKVREGDQLTVPDGGLVRIVYFDGGRQETWKGPASFKAGTRQAEAISGKADVSQVPGGASPKLAQTTEVLQIAKLGRAGGVTVRGVKKDLSTLPPAQQAEVAQAKKTYESWKVTAPADDITPEMYYYLVLQDYMLYEEMRGVVKSMQTKQPHSQAVAELAAWVASRQN
ncbi:MAG: hypothetical protein JWN73_3150 [Betaproteobacteria bacterium]|nr:hypothetical protein [Betaproteobacteria bacterium]